jgi:protein-tyrosine kinase
MERIKEAIERAKSEGARLGGHEQSTRRAVPLARPEEAVSRPPMATAKLSEAHLESTRIVAHRPSNPMTTAFDVLRTSVLRQMDAHGWQTIAVSSPTQGCGKTVTAINLALSLARQADRHVVLIDLDMRRPLVGNYLGFKQKNGLFQALSNEIPLAHCMVHLDVASPQLSVIANSQPIANPAEVISSKEMAHLFQQITATPQKPIVVVDTSPMLECDDVMALLPRLDCLVLAVAERLSTATDVKACERMLQTSNYLGLILTKSHEKSDGYYY